MQRSEVSPRRARGQQIAAVERREASVSRKRRKASADACGRTLRARRRVPLHPGACRRSAPSLGVRGRLAKLGGLVTREKDDACARVPGAAQHKRSEVMRCRPGTPVSSRDPRNRGPGSAVHRSAPLHAALRPGQENAGMPVRPVRQQEKSPKWLNDLRNQSMFDVLLRFALRVRCRRAAGADASPQRACRCHPSPLPSLHPRWPRRNWDRHDRRRFHR